MSGSSSMDIIVNFYHLLICLNYIVDYVPFNFFFAHVVGE